MQHWLLQLLLHVSEQPRMLLWQYFLDQIWLLPHFASYREIGTWWQLCVYLETIVATHSFLCSNLECCLVCLLQWGLRSWMGHSVLTGKLQVSHLQLHIPPLWCCNSAHCMCQVSWMHILPENPTLSVCPIFWVVSTAGADDGSCDFWRWTKIAFFLHLRKKKNLQYQVKSQCRWVNNPMSKTTENGSIEMKSCLELAAWWQCWFHCSTITDFGLSWSYHDFLHSLVHDECCACPWTGSY